MDELHLLNIFSANDIRGSFTKIMNSKLLEQEGIEFVPQEIFYSKSNKGVIRGMHFQKPPYEQNKLVHVIRGAVRDVVVDLRRESKEYGKVTTFYLSGNRPQALWIPVGYAHGFECMEDDTIMLYCVSKGYDRDSDTGICWNSIDYQWATNNPIISERDKKFVSFADFITPFI